MLQIRLFTMLEVSSMESKKTLNSLIQRRLQVLLPTPSTFARQFWLPSQPDAKQEISTPTPKQPQVAKA